MKSTIDKAGRVVIPALLRARLNLQPGTELEILVEDSSLRIVRRAPGPKLVKVGNRWVAKPTAPPGSLPNIDVASLIEEERNRWPQ